MKTVMCYGDSNTFGYDPTNGLRYPRAIRWTGVLQKLLGENYQVISEGCNGRTTIYDDPLEGWKNGLDYLKPCLNSHKPLDWVVMMLGSNDLKTCFHASADDIAKGASILVDTIQTFTAEKQGFVPKILLLSPPEIGPAISESPFRFAFDESAITRSKAFAPAFQKIAEAQKCYYLNVANVATASTWDSLHLTPEAHQSLAEAVAQKIRCVDAKESDEEEGKHEY